MRRLAAFCGQSEEYLSVFRRRFTVFAAVIMTLSGLAVSQTRQGAEQAPPPPQQAEAPKIIPGATQGDPTGIPGVDPKSYVIGAEDVIYINVWREKDFTGPEVVRPDGKITLPLIGDVQAQGLTPEALGLDLSQKLSQYINKPEVNVTLSQVNSKRYTISGEVNHAGVFTMVVPISVFQALSNAGGFRDFANTKKIIIVRGDKRIKFNYKEVLAGKKLEQNINLEPGDTIIVP